MIGILAAMDLELEGLLELLDNKKVKRYSAFDFYEGAIGGNDVVLAVCGVGKVNAAMCTQTMIIKYDPDYIINTGVGGGLDRTLNVADVVLATGVCEHDIDISALGESYGLIPGVGEVIIKTSDELREKIVKAAEPLMLRQGIIASGDQFICDSKRAKWIHEQFDAIVCEMEGAAIGHVCYLNNVEFGIIRAISDNGSDEAHMDFEAFKKIAADKTVNIIRNLLID